jgi:MFS transporter, MFS domain-containing protein family, molybdate-anion transporter
MTVQVGAFASTSSSSLSSLAAPISPANSIHKLPLKQFRAKQRTLQQPHYKSRGNNHRQPVLLQLALGFPRGGAVAAAGSVSVLSKLSATPSCVFNSSLIALALITACFKIAQRSSSNSASSTANDNKPEAIVSLQRRFLAVFWLIRCADWLQGPYFYEVYTSKVFAGIPASMSLVSRLFLTGFASTALFGPYVGRATDNYGRKKGTLAFSIIYALGAISTKSPVLQVLFLGRVLSGIGTSLLFSAPESWLVGEAQKSGKDPDGKYLGETFGLVRSHDTSVLAQHSVNATQCRC